jgi:hypothetical protein
MTEMGGQDEVGVLVFLEAEIPKADELFAKALCERGFHAMPM